jgi:hypothetical protein
MALDDLGQFEDSRLWMKVTTTLTPESRAITIIARSMVWTNGSGRPRKAADEIINIVAPSKYPRIDNGWVH